jgi:hypothetical protein
MRRNGHNSPTSTAEVKVAWTCMHVAQVTINIRAKMSLVHAATIHGLEA